MGSITTEQIAAYARALGCSLNEARELLRGMNETLRGRVIRAAMTQIRAEPQPLHDPIEDEPAVRTILDQAEREAKVTLAARGVREQMGYCHLLWQEKADILEGRYGIVWFSPADMNPDAMYD